MITYDNLWATMAAKNITQYQMIKDGFSTGTLDALRKNKSITINTLDALCHYLNCTPNEILVYSKEETI